MLAPPTTATYRRPSITRAAARGAGAGLLVTFFFFVVVPVCLFVAFVACLFVAGFVLSHLPADTLPAP